MQCRPAPSTASSAACADLCRCSTINAGHIAASLQSAGLFPGVRSLGRYCLQKLLESLGVRKRREEGFGESYRTVVIEVAAAVERSILPGR